MVLFRYLEMPQDAYKAFEMASTVVASSAVSASP